MVHESFLALAEYFTMHSHSAGLTILILHPCKSVHAMLHHAIPIPLPLSLSRQLYRPIFVSLSKLLSQTSRITYLSSLYIYIYLRPSPPLLSIRPRSLIFNWVDVHDETSV